MSNSKKRHLSSSSKSPSSKSPLHKRFSFLPSMQTSDSENDMATVIESSAFDTFMKDITNISCKHESEGDSSESDEEKDSFHSQLTQKQMWIETQKSIKKLSKNVEQKAKSDQVLVKYY